MKKSTLLFIIVTSVTSLFGQTLPAAKSRFMAFGENESWLKTVKSLNKSDQWTAIKQRYFSSENWNGSHDSIQYSPLIIVDGVPLSIPGTFNKDYNKKVLSLVNDNVINSINVIDSLSEQWIFCKPFAGVIILSVDDKTAKKLSKLN